MMSCKWISQRIVIYPCRLGVGIYFVVRGMYVHFYAVSTHYYRLTRRVACVRVPPSTINAERAANFPSRSGMIIKYP